MEITDKKLKELLVDPGHVEAKEFKKLSDLSQESDKSIQTLLIEKGLIKSNQLGQLIAEEFGVKYADLETSKIDEDVMKLIPEVISKSRKIIALEQTDDEIKLGMNNPEDIEIIHNIEKKIGKKVVVYYVSEADLEKSLKKYKAGLKTEISDILDRLKNPNISKEESDETTVLIVDKLMHYAYDNEASDIHVEPHRDRVLVRFRVDGILHDVLDIPRELSELIVTRIKILSKMRTDEHRKAQDGKFRFEVEHMGKLAEVDVRVSVLPVTSGENIVMRLLSSHIRQYGLEDIGLGPADYEKVMKAIDNPHGMVLVTGPTGSGKTTTLYSVLKILNTREVHISTIEDPVEYDIEGVSQIQVNVATDLTFAKGLRSIVRQDPDIIMVGEIRDNETADIAVNSAMTGHLVLSTLHTNDSATTLPRLADLGVEPFLISSTVNVVIAQRLVRKICQNCRSSSSISEKNIALIEGEASLKEAFDKLNQKNLKNVLVFEGKGCNVCHQTGYTGRLGIFEVLDMTDDIKKLVQSNAPSNEIMKAAKANGMSTMLEDGIQKVLNGVTTIEEVLRVTKE